MLVIGLCARLVSTRAGDVLGVYHVVVVCLFVCCRWERIARVGEAASARAAAAAGLGAARALEPLAAALQHELAAKLTATDHLLRDNIDKLATSKVNNT